MLVRIQMMDIRGDQGHVEGHKAFQVQMRQVENACELIFSLHGCRMLALSLALVEIEINHKGAVGWIWQRP